MGLLGVINPSYVASGFVVGVLVGMTGVGGGSLMTPLLILLFGLDARIAVGTDLLYAALTKTAGSMVHGSAGAVDWRITGRLAMGSIPAAVLTIVALYVLGPTNKQASTIIGVVLGAALIVTASCVFARPLLLRLMQAVAPTGLFKAPHGGDDRLWRASRRAGVDLVGWRRCDRYGGARLSLPRGADSAAGWVGHRPCGAADLGRRARPLAARLGQHRDPCLASNRLDSRDRYREPTGVARAGFRAAAGAGRDACPRRDQDACLAALTPPAVWSPASRGAAQHPCTIRRASDDGYASNRSRNGNRDRPTYTRRGPSRSCADRTNPRDRGRRAPDAPFSSVRRSSRRSACPRVERRFRTDRGSARRG